MRRTGNIRKEKPKMDIDLLRLPKYKCHKEVHALKIKSIFNPNEGLDQEDDGERVITFSDSGCEALAFLVDRGYIQKHKPYVGGYFVVYADGYRSFSPPDVFADGYTRI